MSEAWRDMGEMEIWMGLAMALVKEGAAPSEAGRVADLFVKECRARRPAILAPQTRQ